MSATIAKAEARTEVRIDFYQLSRDPAEHVVPLLARASKQAGKRLLVVSGDEGQIDRIDKALWERLPDAFLAHGRAGDKYAPRQPLLLSQGCDPENAAEHILIADGLWRDEALAFERAFLLFDEATIEGARACWRKLDELDGAERHYWAREDGKWVQKA